MYSVELGDAASLSTDHCLGDNLFTRGCGQGGWGTQRVLKEGRVWE